MITHTNRLNEMIRQGSCIARLALLLSVLALTISVCSADLLASPLDGKLEIAAGGGIAWFTNGEFIPTSGDPITTHLKVIGSAGTNMFAVDLVFYQFMYFDSGLNSTTVVALGPSTQLGPVNVSVLAAAWIEPYFNLSWIELVLRVKFPKWIFWELEYSFPLNSSSRHSLIGTVGVTLNLFQPRSSD